MKKIIWTICGIMLGISTSSSAASYDPLSENVFDTYGDNVEYQTYSKMDFSTFAAGHEDVAKQIDIDMNGELDLPAHRAEKLEAFILESLAQRRIQLAQISGMSAKEVIDLTLKIVSDQLQWKNVDIGGKKNFDECLIEGKGDCDKFSDSMSWIFRWFKKFNPNLGHIVITKAIGGSTTIEHAWNSILVFTPAQLITTQVDPTFYDYDCNFDADKGYHFSGLRSVFMANFYDDLFEYNASTMYYVQALSNPNTVEKLKSNRSKETVKWKSLVDRIGFIAFVLADPEKMEWLVQTLVDQNFNWVKGKNILEYASLTIDDFKLANYRPRAPAKFAQVTSKDGYSKK